MPPATTRLGPLNDILAGTIDTAAQDAPVDALAGFDVVAQFSQALLNQQVVRSLVGRRLASLAAYVPWGTVALPPALAATVPPRLHLVLATTLARLEIRLVQPYLSALHWPVDITGGGADPVVVATARRRGGAAARRGSSGTARGGPRSRTVDVGWHLEVNLLTARLDASVLARSSSRPSSGTAPAGGAIGIAGLPDSAGVLADPSDSGGSGGAWDRLVLATGTVMTGATAALDVPAGRWQFGMTLDFGDTGGVASSDNEGVTAFLAESGASLLAQALAPLKAAAGLRLTPRIAPAGAISAAAVARHQLPPFTVRDRLLAGEAGRPVLALCAEVAGPGGGVPRLVQPLLGRLDFAYAVSQDVLAPAYRACWNAAASGLSFVGEAPVELPVGDDPAVTATGRARLQISFADRLDDVAIVAVPEGLGDAVRLLARQRIQLLELWDHEGRRITDLGDYGKPQEETMALPLSLFARPTAETAPANPNFKDLLMKLMGILLLPMSEPFRLRADSVSGYCSSARRAMLVRWALRTWRDDVRPPVVGTVMGRA